MGRREFLGRSALVAGALAIPAWATKAATAALPSAKLRALAKSIHGTVVAPGSASYNQGRLLESTRFDATHPEAIVYCANATDVQKTMVWALKNGVHVVPRSGGHSYGGYSTTSGGVVIDVSRLNAIHPVGKTAVIGAGAQLIDVYSQLFAHGVTIPGGSCATVGIAGLTLGGGVGFTSRAFGLACDNVESLQIVTPAGQLLTCDSSHHSDLFWACRGGGGGNFGIVTSFTFKTHPISTVSTYFVEWPWNQAVQAVRAWQAFAPTAPDALFSVCDLESTDPGTGARSHVVSSGQYFGSEQALLALLKPLTDTGTPLNVTTHTRTGIEAALFWAGCGSETVAQCHLSPRGTMARSTFLAKSDFVAKPLSAAAVTTMVTAINARQTTPTLGHGALLMDSYGGAINRVPKAATAFVHRDQLFAIQYTAQYPAGAPASRVAANTQWLNNLHTALGTAVSGQAYQNYIDPGLVNWQAAYYGSNLPRLQQVKRKYDPGNVFHFAQSIRL
jgi:FAD/FMN-containing dehydrogenase